VSAQEVTEVTMLDATLQVMIVEDNGPIAALHKRIVDAVPYLRTAHIARNGEQAFHALRSVCPDLVILDLTMAGGDGLSFLRRVRYEGIPVDVIVVTASRGGRVVQDVMHLGVIDYLVKPFTPQRLRRALAAFALRQRTLMRTSELSQADVDTLQASGSGRDGDALPKGFTQATLSAVVAILRAAREPLSAEEVGRAVGIARVTARRYLEYLQLADVVEMSRQLVGPGRPKNRYAIKKEMER
jgi:two-component system response regulator DctR